MQTVEDQSVASAHVRPGCGNAGVWLGATSCSDLPAPAPLESRFIAIAERYCREIRCNALSPYKRVVVAPVPLHTPSAVALCLRKRKTFWVETVQEETHRRTNTEISMHKYHRGRRSAQQRTQWHRRRTPRSGEPALLQPAYRITPNTCNSSSAASSACKQCWRV